MQNSMLLLAGFQREREAMGICVLAIRVIICVIDFPKGCQGLSTAALLSLWCGLVWYTLHEG